MNVQNQILYLVLEVLWLYNHIIRDYLLCYDATGASTSLGCCFVAFSLWIESYPMAQQYRITNGRQHRMNEEKQVIEL